VALANDGIPPNKFELRMRFGFGFVLGVVLGVTGWLQSMGPHSWLSVVLAALGSGLVSGTLARHYGDRYWTSVRWWS
jgi:hypothetical protein